MFTENDVGKRPGRVLEQIEYTMYVKMTWLAMGSKNEIGYPE